MNIMKRVPTFLKVKSMPTLPIISPENEDAPAIVEFDSASDAGSDDSSVSSSDVLSVPVKRRLQWEFTGLTIWVELEEFNGDLTRAIHDLACIHGVEPIPQSHMTAIYGMEHLTVEEAKAKLHQVKEHIPSWPMFDKPVGVVSDIAVNGRPGQVCTIAWSELTMSSNPAHEKAMDILHEIFFGTDYKRTSEWKPHNSLAYDNPEDHNFSLGALVAYIATNPTILTKRRRVSGLSLWSTYGKMEDWKCLDRINFL